MNTIAATTSGANGVGTEQSSAPKASGSDLLFKEALACELNELTSSSSSQPPLTPEQEEKREEAQAWQDAVANGKNNYRKHGAPEQNAERNQMQKEIQDLIKKYPNAFDPRITDEFLLMAKLEKEMAMYKFLGGHIPKQLQDQYNACQSALNKLEAPFLNLDPNHITETISLVMSKLEAHTNGQFKPGTAAYKEAQDLRSLENKYLQNVSRIKWLNEQENRDKDMWNNVPMAGIK